MSGNAIWHLMDGPLTPYVGAGLGWTWIDTNVPTGPPVTGCWWDPWWGYVCYTDYPTKTTDAFSYQAILGVRYEFNPRPSCAWATPASGPTLRTPTAPPASTW